MLLHRVARGVCARATASSFYSRGALRGTSCFSSASGSTSVSSTFPPTILEPTLPHSFVTLKDVVDQLEEVGPQPVASTAPHVIVERWEDEATAIREWFWMTDLWKVVVTTSEQPCLETPEDSFENNGGLVGDDPNAVGPTYYAHITYKPSIVRRKRKHGFLARLRCRHGRKILARRKAKGRGKRLCV